MLCGTCRWKAVCLQAQGQQWPRWKKPCNELSKDFRLIERVLLQVLLRVDELLKRSKPIGFTNVVFACKVRVESYSTHCTNEWRDIIWFPHLVGMRKLGCSFASIPARESYGRLCEWSKSVFLSSERKTCGPFWISLQFLACNLQ